MTSRHHAASAAVATALTEAVTRPSAAECSLRCCQGNTTSMAPRNRGRRYPRFPRAGRGASPSRVRGERHPKRHPSREHSGAGRNCRRVRRRRSASCRRSSRPKTTTGATASTSGVTPWANHCAANRLVGRGRWRILPRHSTMQPGTASPDTVMAAITSALPPRLRRTCRSAYASPRAEHVDDRCGRSPGRAPGKSARRSPSGGSTPGITSTPRCC